MNEFLKKFDLLDIETFYKTLVIKIMRSGVGIIKYTDETGERIQMFHL